MTPSKHPENDTGLLRRLLPWFKPYTKPLIWALGSLGVVSASSLIRPLLLGRLTLHAEERSMAALLWDGVFLALLLLLGLGFSFVEEFTLHRVGARCMAELRAALFQRVQHMPLKLLDRTTLGRLLARILHDVDTLGELFTSGFLHAVGDVGALLGMATVMLVVNLQLALIVFVFFFLSYGVMQFVRRRSREAYRLIRSSTAEVTGFLSEQLSGMATVQSCGAEGRMGQAFDRLNVAYRDANKKAVFYEAVLDASIEWIGNLAVAAVLAWIAWTQQGAGAALFSFALVVAFTQYIRQAFEPIGLLAQRFSVLQSALSGGERIVQLLDEPGEPIGGGQGLSVMPASTQEVLAMDRVSFGYHAEGRQVLRDVSLSIQRGEKVALVGATGAGKSTVLSLFLRLYEPTQGSLRLWGQELQSYSLKTLRQQFSVVPQDVHLFPGTLAQNIALGEEPPDLERIEDLLTRLGVLDLFVRRLGGLEAALKGDALSAGERQLLAFARALYREAPVLLLDEATARIDSATESQLRTAFEVATQGRTVLMVAHRLATVQAADRLFVFQQGAVVESGTHAELLSQDGVYSTLYRLQKMIAGT